MRKTNEKPYNITIKKHPVAGTKLDVKIHGSKNCALALVMYTFLVGKGNNIKIKNIPPLTDIINTLEMFKLMGGVFEYTEDKNELIVFEGIKTNKIPNHLLCRTRISVLLMSIMLVKYGKVSFPKKVGGCDLGHRPYDYHLDAFKKLGCVIKEDVNTYAIKKNNPVKNKILRFKNETTTGTENALFLANFNSKNIIIKKAHQRPEILELIKFMNKLGGRIEIKTSGILIKGTQKIIENKKATFTIIDDMEEALSYIALGLATDSYFKLQFNNPYKYKEIETLVDLCRGSLKKEGHFLTQTPYTFPKHEFIKITTGAYPAFSSDAQPIMAAILLKISESFKIIETRFEERFKYSEYFDKFGIKNEKDHKFITVSSTQQDDNYFEIKDIPTITAYDLRAAMNAILTVSVIKKKVTILNASLILRGYANFFDIMEALKFKITQS